VDDVPDAEYRKVVEEFGAITGPRRKIRAYFDANIPASVGERARARLRWDVLSVQEHPNLASQEDEFHYTNARKLKRILFTLDRHFLDDRRFPLRQSPGVYVLTAAQDSPDEIFWALWFANRMLWEMYRKVPTLHLGTKVLLTPEGERIRYITRESEIHELFAPL
jgi:predicted nuclease of predicted toxin-antitoxin system